MSPCPKLNPIRDQKYKEWLRTQPCILTGYVGNDCETVDPLHVGTLGKGIKSSDDEMLPVKHDLHQRGHENGEMSMFRGWIPDWLLREALRAYAREMYATWKQEQGR